MKNGRGQKEVEYCFSWRYPPDERVYASGVGLASAAGGASTTTGSASDAGGAASGLADGRYCKNLSLALSNTVFTLLISAYCTHAPIKQINKTNNQYSKRCVFWNVYTSSRLLIP